MDLGFEQAGGFNTVAMCDNNPDRRADLARLFPGVKVYDDVSTLSATRLQTDGIPRPDVICGGFPCQDISVARGASARGLDGDRSGLWFEYARLIEENKPDWIVIENSPRLRHLGLETILRFLDASGYDAFWDGIPARAVGAYHQRDRLFIVANCNGSGLAFWKGFRSHLGAELAAIKRDAISARSQGPDQSGMAGTIYDVPPTLDGPISRAARAIWKSRLHGLGNSCVPPICLAIGRAIMNVDGRFSA